jgi:hypothetical protein
LHLQLFALAFAFAFVEKRNDLHLQVAFAFSNYKSEYAFTAVKILTIAQITSKYYFTAIFASDYFFTIIMLTNIL